jgi:broad specificity phosphatase PhoE
MKKLYLLRHGETDWNREGRYQGQSDVPLNAQGQKQARFLAEQMADVDVTSLYASDLSRAIDTANAVSKSVNCEVQIVPEFREIHQGEWEGMLFPDIKEKYSKELRDRKSDPLNVAPPGGETVGQFKDRILSGFRKVLGQHKSGDTVVIVSHGFTIAVARVHFSGLDIRDVWEYVPHNTDITYLEV